MMKRINNKMWALADAAYFGWDLFNTRKEAREKLKKQKNFTYVAQVLVTEIVPPKRNRRSG